MGNSKFLDKFMSGGNVEDYLAYKSEVTGQPIDVPSADISNILGAHDEDKLKWFDTPGSGLWRKR